MIFQTRSMVAMQEIQPQMKALQKQYSSRDMETQQKLQAEMKKFVPKHGASNGQHVAVASSNASFDCLIPSNLADTSVENRFVPMVTTWE